MANSSRAHSHTQTQTDDEFNKKWDNSFDEKRCERDYKKNYHWSHDECPPHTQPMYGKSFDWGMLYRRPHTQQQNLQKELDRCNGKKALPVVLDISSDSEEENTCSRNEKAKSSKGKASETEPVQARKLADKDAAFSPLESQNHELRQEHQVLKDENQALKQENENAWKEVNDLSHANDHFVRENKELTRKLEEKQKELEAKEKELETKQLLFKEEVRSKRTLITTLIKENRSLKEESKQNAIMRESWADMRDKCDRSVARCDGCRSDFTLLELRRVGNEGLMCLACAHASNIAQQGTWTAGPEKHSSKGGGEPSHSDTMATCDCCNTEKPVCDMDCESGDAIA